MTSTPLLRSKLFWVGLLYFIFPLGIFCDPFPARPDQAPEAFWIQAGASLGNVRHGQ